MPQRHAPILLITHALLCNVRSGETIFMLMRTLVLAALAVGILVSAAQAADATGKWTAQIPARGPAGRGPTELTFVLKAEGKNLTGSVNGGRGGDSALRDGVVNGDEISFTAEGAFGGDAFYKGKVSGDTIAFSRTMEGEDYGTKPTNLTASRVK